ncbi:MAG: tyrosine-type recombinase/integrase [Oligosphaeraceae bacterium]
MQTLTFVDWVTKWLTQKESFVKASTLAAYTNIIVTHLLPKFRDYQLDALTAELLQEYALELIRSGRLDKQGGMAIRSAKGVMVVLKNILQDAMRQKLMPREEIAVKFPSLPQSSKVKTLPKQNQQKLLRTICQNLTPLNGGILLAMHTGLRIGEICGLKWSDISLETGIIQVNRTLQRIYSRSLSGNGKSHIHIGTPKTRTSAREVPISSFLMPMLQRLKPENPDTFFLSGTNKSVEVRTFRDYFHKLLEKNNITKINFHALRHTFASRCIEAGADCKTVSEILGHASVAMTMNLYVHPVMEQKRKCVELLICHDSAFADS